MYPRRPCPAPIVVAVDIVARPFLGDDRVAVAVPTVATVALRLAREGRRLRERSGHRKCERQGEDAGHFRSLRITSL
jgi:hypothetical protein